MITLNLVYQTSQIVDKIMRIFLKNKKHVRSLKICSKIHFMPAKRVLTFQVLNYFVIY